MLAYVLDYKKVASCLACKTFHSITRITKKGKSKILYSNISNKTSNKEVFYGALLPGEIGGSLVGL